MIVDTFHDQLLYRFYLEYGEYVVFKEKENIHIDYSASWVNPTITSTSCRVIPLNKRICAEFFKRPLSINEKYEKPFVLKHKTFIPKNTMQVIHRNVVYNIKEITSLSTYVHMIICTSFNGEESYG